jgi:NAD(P)H dehydrogenase (quinone)
MTIAITGATGQLGRVVVAKLKGKVPAVDIVALARSPAKAADLGVTVREADYAKPETLASALAGEDTLLLISSSEIGRRAAQHRNIIEVAKKAGVKRIVYPRGFKYEIIEAFYQGMKHRPASTAFPGIPPRRHLHRHYVAQY